MTKYVIRRLIQAFFLLFIISIVVFVLMNESGDPLATMGGRQPPRPEDRARLERQLGLDKPVMVRYIYWLIGNDWTEVDVDGDGEGDTPGTKKGVIRGDFGDSFRTRQPALDVIWDYLPNTLRLMIPAQVLIVVVALFIGIYSALNQYSIFDNILTGFAFVAFSMPIFFVALALIHIFSVELDMLPASGMYDPIKGESTSELIKHLILPVGSLVLIGLAKYSRYVRASMLEVINSDYIRTAKSKGLRESTVLFTHAFRNAILPIVTLIGLDIPFLLAGAVVTENIFAWPGMGRLFLESINRSDFPVLMCILMMTAAAVVVFQLLTDLVYTMLDPRIRLS
ncbi:MAG: ABC transporter permease [Anaerolineae bacterium]|jgi:peptide/nickel transport system permease protein|nr:MAG: ABC transporter permease [Anaerolineae bacterium]MCL4876163.1 ABC transporter permease [Anaerolineae bacterium]